jgi:metal-responsive CopG/Arc/MetJ family transcriptional regulator
MALKPKDPLLKGAVVSKTIALPEELWKALDLEVLVEEAKSRSSLAAELLADGIHQLRAMRAKAGEKAKP